MSETGLIRAYSGLTKVMAPILPLWLKRRALKGKEDPTRQGERFGIASMPRPKGRLCPAPKDSSFGCTAQV